MQAGGVALNFDASQVQVEDRAEAIPAGWYNVVVTNTERKPSSKKPQNHYLEVTHTIIDGPYANRKLFNRINMWNDDATAMEIAYKGANGIAALQQAVGVPVCQTSAQLHGIPLKVKVKLRPAGPGGDGKHYEASNEITKYAHINADVGGSEPAGGAPTPSWLPGGAAPAPAPAPVPQAPQAAAPFPGAAPAPAPAPQYNAAPAPQAAAPAPAQGFPPQAQQPWPQPGAAPAPAPQAAPPPAMAGAPAWVANAQAAAPAPAPAPPPTPAAPAPQAPPPGPIMLPAAEGVSYEDYRKAGWTDEALVAHGKMAPAQAAPPPPTGAPVPAAPPTGVAPWVT